MSEFTIADVELYLQVTRPYWNVCPVILMAAGYVATLVSTTDATAEESRLVVDYLSTLPLPASGQPWPQPVDALAHVRKLQASRWN